MVYSRTDMTTEQPARYERAKFSHSGRSGEFDGGTIESVRYQRATGTAVSTPAAKPITTGY